MNKRLTLVPRGDSPTVAFAARELKKYLRMMMPESGDIPIDQDPAAEGIHLGVLEDFGLPLPAGLDKELDDVLHIEVAGGKGVIAGSNPRAVLAAAYRYLHENGCRWPRPGVDGEVIPVKPCGSVSYRHTASMRYRGLCIEGAVSQQNMLENVEWAPKVGYNSYMMEFKTPYTFYDKWYTHRDNPEKQSEWVDLNNVRQWCAALETEIQLRGLQYHAVGHAWTCEPFGFSGDGWDAVDLEMDDGTRQMLAMVDGKRGLYKGITLNTNICMSNPKAREILVQYCADYAQTNSQVQYLHIWLADAANNHCECENCAPIIPADLYVVLLNEIDAELAKRALPTRLVFLAYLDLLWPPQKNRLNNPDRFALLFAPITRTYTETYSGAPFTGRLTPYVRNKLDIPKDLKENIEFMRQWRRMFSGDGFLYEYYFWLDHYNDMAYYEMAKTISEDIKNLSNITMQGLISDQTQRSFFPTGFPMYVMGQTLYDVGSDFEALARDYFATAFGADGEKCRAYLSELSALFSPDYLRGNMEMSGNADKAGGGAYVDEGAAKRLEKIAPLVNGFRTTVEANLAGGTRAVDLSWRYLLVHGELCKRLAAAYIERARGRDAKARELWRQAAAYACRHEDELQDVFDVYSFVHALERKF